MTSPIRLAAALAALMVAAGLPSPGAAQHKIKYSTFSTATNPIVQCAWFKTLDAILAKADGALEIERYLGGTAFGNPTKQYDFIARGVMDMSSGVLEYKPGAFPLAELINLPFMVQDAGKAALAYNRVMRKRFANEFDDVHLMWIGIVAPYQFHLRKPIDSLAEIKGMRIRIAGEAATAALKLLGAQPAPMPVTQQYENLQKGVIDGTASAWASILPFKLTEVTKFHYEVNFSSSSIFMGMSKKAYAALPAKAKAAVDAYSTAEDGARASDCWDGLAPKAKAEATKAGSTIKVLTKEERAEYRKIVQPVTDAYIADLEKNGLPGREVYNELRAAIDAEEAR
jgi:TRAP-type C4-dicarboxylate transport system substrate-binding protein